MGSVATVDRFTYYDCFWCNRSYFRSIFKMKEVILGVVGFLLFFWYDVFCVSAQVIEDVMSVEEEQVSVKDEAVGR